MAHNGQASGSGGVKTCLRKDEAAFFHRHHITVPPGMRLPSGGGGWQMGALDYVVPPLLTGERFRDLVRLRRWDLTPEQQANPEYAVDSPNWRALLEAQRDAALDDHEGTERPYQHNAVWRRRWWEGRDLYTVMQEHGFDAPIDRSRSDWQMSSSSSSSSSARSTTPTTPCFVKIEAPPINNSGRRIKVKQESGWSAPPCRNNGVTIRDFGPAPPTNAPRAKVKLEPETSSSRGKKRAATPPPLPLTDEQVKALYQRDLAIATKLSFDMIQPASREFAEHWSCVENNIIDLDAEVQIPTSPGKEEVKGEAEEAADALPQQEAGAWNVEHALATYDCDQFYGYWTGGS